MPSDRNAPPFDATGGAFQFGDERRVTRKFRVQASDEPRAYLSKCAAAGKSQNANVHTRRLGKGQLAIRSSCAQCENGQRQISSRSPASVRNIGLPHFGQHCWNFSAIMLSSFISKYPRPSVYPNAALREVVVIAHSAERFPATFHLTVRTDRRSAVRALCNCRLQARRPNVITSKFNLTVHLCRL